MKPALVTGASGFLGWHVARTVLERGLKVRVLARRAGSVQDLDAEVVEGDLRDAAAVERAVRGCGLVFHVAADYRLWVKRPEELYKTNVEGARHILDAATRAGVERVVYTSTVGCIGFVEGGLGDESSAVSFDDMTGHYKKSKWLAEQLALDAARKGAPVVIVNPTAPVGAHDVKPTPTGQTILDFLKGRMPAYVDTGLNVVDATDAAEGHWLACERGRAGERYILGSENLTLRQIFEQLSAMTGLRAPRVQLPWAVALAAGAAMTLWAGISGKPPRAPLDAVRMARRKMWVTHAKAARELGYKPSPAEAGLRKSVEWFKAHGYC